MTACMCKAETLAEVAYDKYNPGRESLLYQTKADSRHRNIQEKEGKKTPPCHVTATKNMLLFSSSCSACCFDDGLVLKESLFCHRLNEQMLVDGSKVGI